ncbi:hypothetical protein H5186_18625 [Pseudoalteromonas sp. SG41-2]|uniref:hypothetical protein n=1 Tax=Pseudoalteromonas sp. SG41-2 TaxID=2760978 RepID=UPI00160472B6|nr:hypothetical protein [Pseudoalteromonas sp. SG41-2]MBB1481450.1 hypothetical protein [Pseudoalteromonas sp. SG41-2]
MTKFKYYRNLSLSVICIALGLAIGFLNLNQVNNGFPFKSHLVEKSGLVDWVQAYDYGIRFGFVNDPMSFNYPSKSSGQSVVEESLLKSKDQLVTILFEASNTHSPIYSSKIYYDFFELKVNGLLVRSYEESEQAWKSDNKLTPFIVALFLIGGTYIWRKTKKEYKYTRY